MKENYDDKVWTPDTWKNFKISQQPVYKEQDKLESVLKKISSLPPIVNHREVDVLRKKLELVLILFINNIVS